MTSLALHCGIAALLRPPIRPDQTTDEQGWLSGASRACHELLKPQMLSTACNAIPMHACMQAWGHMKHMPTFVQSRRGGTFCGHPLRGGRCRSAPGCCAPPSLTCPVSGL